MRPTLMQKPSLIMALRVRVWVDSNNKNLVIPRSPDRGIQRKRLDCPVEPDNDEI